MCVNWKHSFTTKSFNLYVLKNKNIILHICCIITKIKIFNIGTLSNSQSILKFSSTVPIKIFGLSSFFNILLSFLRVCVNVCQLYFGISLNMDLSVYSSLVSTITFLAGIPQKGCGVLLKVCKCMMSVYHNLDDMNSRLNAIYIVYCKIGIFSFKIIK